MHFNILVNGQLVESFNSRALADESWAKHLTAIRERSSKPAYRNKKESVELRDSKTDKQLRFWQAMTPEEIVADRMQSVQRKLKTMLERGKEGIEEAATRISATITSEDPERAFAWLDGHFERAAQYRVAAVMNALLNPEEGEARTLEQVYEWVNGEAMRGARYPQRSTGQCHNIWHQCMTAAWAEAAEDLKQTLSWNHNQ